MTSFFHPTMAFFGLALVLLLLARNNVTWWRWLLPVAPILAIISVFSSSAGRLSAHLPTWAGPELWAAWTACR
jgi:hypothetical protein